MLAAEGVIEMMKEESTGGAESAGEMDVLKVLAGAATELSKSVIGGSNLLVVKTRRGKRIKKSDMHNGTGASKKAADKTDTSVESQQKKSENKKPMKQNSPPPAAEKEDHVHLSVREKSKAVTPQEEEEAERKKKVRVIAQT